METPMDLNHLILDVRTPLEFAQGNHPGSLNIPLQDLPQRFQELDPRRPLVVCCASGGRSSMAKALLDRLGFEDVRDAGPWHRVPALLPNR
jgi:rhodanese-related sulfurtransferase